MRFVSPNTHLWASSVATLMKMVNPVDPVSNPAMARAYRASADTNELSHVFVCVHQQPKVNAAHRCVFAEKEKRSGEVRIVGECYLLARGVQSASKQ
jgi:hypothetical protein